MESAVPSAPKMSFTDLGDNAKSREFPQQPPPYQPPPYQPVPYQHVAYTPSPSTGLPYQQVVVQPMQIHMSPISFQGTPASQAKKSINIACDRCRNQVKSEVRIVAGACTYVSCMLCCCLGLWPCCYYPFCIDSMQDIEHHCPICSNLLGLRKACS
mmetsp:Transcript_1654/g.3561  ORF Transcript_1654/g.3561 Transcript_1654/m.3561 type:complete len:156 (+) Transcript_1654:4461-4928(+)